MRLINIYIGIYVFQFQFEIKIPLVSCSLISKKLKNIPKKFGHSYGRGRATPIFGKN